ncbi:MAG: CopG family transcriptional regulator [Propionibacteriaceae bacterium]|jgi:hypothetical protein|nr:CopG family transcriptional regulator [Propionibacteriaceae bacterium]
MRSNIRIDDDVATAVDRLRQERPISLATAADERARAGLRRARKPRRPFVQRTYDIGVTLDCHNIGDALETLDGPDHQ